MPSQDYSYGYKLPPIIETDERRCFCVELPDLPEYRMAFYDLVSKMCHWWTWGRDLDHNALKVSDYLKNILLPQLECEFMCCGDGFNFMQFNLQNKIYSDSLINLDNGVTYLSFAPDAPDTSWTSDTTDTTAPLQQKRKNALCDAIRAYMQLELHYWGDLVGVGGVVEGVLSTALLLIPGAQIFGLIAVAVAGLSTAAFLSVLNDAEAITNVICTMYTALDGKAISFDTFKASCNPNQGADGSHQRILAGWLNGANQKTENYHAFVAYLGTAFTLATESDTDVCSNCECSIPLEIFAGAPVELIFDGNCTYHFTLPAHPYTVDIQRVGGGCFEIVSYTNTSGVWHPSFELCGIPGFTGSNWVGGLSYQSLRAVADDSSTGGITITFVVQ